MKIVFYGLTITSSWGNGHATTYRALAKALAARGHSVHFVEKDVEWYRNHRDLPRPAFCTVHLYENWTAAERSLVALSADADAIVVGSYFPDAKAASTALMDADCGPVFFYDIDTPITLAQLRSPEGSAYLDRKMIPHYTAYLSFTGGSALSELELEFGSPRAIAFYCSVDPQDYRPMPCRAEFDCALSYLGTYAADRQPKLMRLLNETAGLLPTSRFLVAGSQYPKDLPWARNVERLDHVPPAEHPAFYCSSQFTLNLTRRDMVAAGYSPSVRLFEASACGAAILSDSWPGLAEFLTPGSEVLVAADAYEVADILRHTSPRERKRLGQRARERILAQHTSAHRAQQFEQIVRSSTAVPGMARHAVDSRSSSELTHAPGAAARS
jgi:spore maturation protein CgeB